MGVKEVGKLLGLQSGSHISPWENRSSLPTLTNALRLPIGLHCPSVTLFFNLCFEQAKIAVRQTGFVLRGARMERERDVEVPAKKARRSDLQCPPAQW